MSKRFDVYQYETVNPKLVIRVYTSFKEICEAWTGRPKNEFDSVPWPGTEGPICYAEFERRSFKNTDEQAWGFYQHKTKTVNIWFSKLCSTRYLMSVIAHEIGHCMEDQKPKKDSEYVAKTYEHTALLAWDWAFKLQNERLYGI